MPLIQESTYRPPGFMSSGHIQSIFPSIFRKIETDFYQRERIKTNDNDFLDLDWARNGSKNLAIISHGLEGSSKRSYVVGMVKALIRNGWDALAWNFRSCSGEMNRQLRFYHSGATDDLECVVNHALNNNTYDKIVLIGFSMGGNLTLVYLGEKGLLLDPKIIQAVTFSVPCDLKASALALAKPQNKLYMNRFLRMLHEKIRTKMEFMPDSLNDSNYGLIKTFEDYDNRYTAPLHGFSNAEDYWSKCSSRQFIPGIKIPTLIVNARNDPFLSGGCYPTKEASES